MTQTTPDTTPTLPDLGESVANAPNLDILHTLLVHGEGMADAQEAKLGDYLDLAALPTFGGAEPTDTHGIYSWDEARLLIHDQTWEIVARDEAA